MAYTPFQQPAEFNAPDYWASLQGGNSGGMQTRMGPNGLEILDPRTLRWMPYGAPQPSATSPGFTATTTPTAYVPTAESITYRPPDVPGPGGNVNTANNPPPPAITYRPPDVPGPGGNVNTANNPPPTTTVSYRPPDVPGPYGNVNTTNNPAPVTPPSPVTPPPSGFSNPSLSLFGPGNYSEQSGHLPPAPGFNPDGSRYGYTFAQQDAARAAIATPAPPIRTDPVRPPGGYADGGPIRGPGGPRQDNLLVRASNGEFVVPADVVRHKGTEFFSRLIDKSREDSPGFAVPRGFADGGEVVDPTQGIDVPTSGSPGYADLPSEGQPPAPVSEASAPSPGYAPQQAAAPAPAQNPVAAYKAQRNVDDQEYLKNLPTDQKVALALQAFGAGVNGGPNPIDALLARKQKREAEFRAEISSSIALIKEGTDILRRTPPGKGRDAMAEMLGRAGGPLVAEALKMVGTDQEDAMKKATTLFENPAVREMAIKMVAGDPDKSGALMKTFGDPHKMAALEKRGDQSIMPNVISKMQLVSRAMSKMPQYQDENGNARFDMKDLWTQNVQLPPNVQFSPAEMSTITRNQAMMSTYGLQSDKALEVGQEANVRKAAAGTWGEPYDMNGAQVQKNSVTGEIRTAVTRAPVTNVSIMGNAVSDTNKDKHGDEFLATLPQATQNIVKGLTDYSVDPAKLSSRQGQREAYIAQAKQVDSNYDPSKFSIRQGVKADFTKGQTSTNLVAIDQAINHMGTYKELTDALKNNDIQRVNQLVNRVKQETGNADITNAKFAQQAVATELMRTFRQVNADADEIKRFEAQLNAAMNSPAQSAGVLQTGAKLLVGRLDAINQKWNRGMDVTTGFPGILSAQATAGLQKLGVKASAGASAPTASAPSAAPVSPGNTPKVSNDADYNALPSGADYIAPDGSQRKKK